MLCHHCRQTAECPQQEGLRGKFPLQLDDKRFINTYTYTHMYETHTHNAHTHAQLPSDSQQLQLTFNCLRAVCCAMGPDSLIPSRPLLATMYCSSSSSYEPRPVNIGRVALPPELQLFLRDFASYLHDCWIYEKVTLALV